LALIVISGCGETQKKITDNNTKTDSKSISEIKSDDQSSNKIKKLIAGQNPSFKMLNTSPSDYLEKEFNLYGFADLSNYYNYKYNDANKSHYSIELIDNDFNIMWIYFSKETNKKLFELLGDKNKVPLKIKAIIKTSRFEDYQTQALLEGLSWEELN